MLQALGWGVAGDGVINMCCTKVILLIGPMSAVGAGKGLR
jgi:hypothetical protein